MSRRGFLLALVAFGATAIGPDRLFLRPEGVRAAETDGEEEQDEGDREGTRGRARDERGEGQTPGRRAGRARAAGDGR